MFLVPFFHVLRQQHAVQIQSLKKSAAVKFTRELGGISVYLHEGLHVPE